MRTACHAALQARWALTAVPWPPRRCGPADNLTRWAELINASRHPLLIENCHWGQAVPTGVPLSTLQLVYEPCDPGSASQTGFHFDAGSRALVKAGPRGSGSGSPLCVQGGAGPLDSHGEEDKALEVKRGAEHSLLGTLHLLCAELRPCVCV